MNHDHLKWLTKTPISHRGLHDQETLENTLLSFQKAIEFGYGIECDVQLAKDGVVVFHDQSLKRLAGNALNVSDLTLKEIQSLPLHHGQKIPTLREALSLISGKVPFLIEIKNLGEAGELEAHVLEELSRIDTAQTAIFSFNPKTLYWFKQHAPHIVRGQVASHEIEIKDVFYKEALQNLVFNPITKPHFIAYDIRYLEDEVVQKARKEMPLLTWTVRTKELLEKSKKYGDNIIFENREILGK